MITDHILCRWICNYGVDCDFNNLPHVIRISHTHTHPTVCMVLFPLSFCSTIHSDDPRATVPTFHKFEKFQFKLLLFAFPCQLRFLTDCTKATTATEAYRIQWVILLIQSPWKKNNIFWIESIPQWMGTLLGLWR